MSKMVYALMRCCIYGNRFLNFIQNGPGENKSASI